MKLYWWYSSLTAQWSVGKLVGMGRNPDEAREAIRRGFEAWYSEQRPWHDDDDADDRAEKQERLRKLEFDLSRDPKGEAECVYVMGSE